MTSTNPADRPFTVLGLQQVAIGGASKARLHALWVDLLGLETTGSFSNPRENVDEDICMLGPAPFSVEIDLMQPLDPAAKPAVHVPPLNHIGLWIDDLAGAVAWLAAQGVRFAPGGIRKGAAGHDVCFIHPKGGDPFPLGGEGVLIELVQAPPAIVAAFGRAASDAHAVLDFWFGESDAAGKYPARAFWFKKDPAFDAQLRERFGALVDDAVSGRLGGWRAVTRDALALIVLADQFTRNIHRGKAASFAGDPIALSMARELVATGRDLALPTAMRSFVYMPFEHSEAIADQDEAVRLFTALNADGEFADTLDYAHRHRAVIARFGRFPHRNAALERPSTPEETEFLAQPGSHF